MTDERIVTTACLYGDCFLCNPDNSTVRTLDGEPVCECECHATDNSCDSKSNPTGTTK